MEKVLQILAVFALLMLFIWRSIRGREDRFRRFSYLARVRPPLAEEVRVRLVVGVFEPKAKDTNEGRAGGAGRSSERSEGYEQGGGGPSEGEGPERGEARAQSFDEVRSSSDEVHGAVGVGDTMEGRKALGVPDEAEAFLWDEESRMLLLYWRDGKLMIYRRMAGGRSRELQELAVPMDCSGIAWDPEERRIYLEEGGDFFVYGPEG